MTHILTQQTDNFEFPKLGAVRTRRGYVDEMITLTSAPVDSRLGDDIRPLQVSMTRTADDDPMFEVPLLDHTIAVLIGEETDHGYSEVVQFDLEQAERFAKLLTAAVESGKADLVANADFLGAAEAVAS
ncbi:hypothetical protein MTX80_15410 [Gordonia amicalis]|nr:hypothetical protein [Gordonia amicalis]UOG20518.1 hypothetical protein MTX80_15410 [Gordonia amicalis]